MFILLVKKSDLGGYKLHMSYFPDTGPKFTVLVSPNAAGIGLGHISFQFSIARLFPEILAIKV